MTPIFTIKNLSFYYPEQERAALDHLNLTVQQGEFLVLCGPSGCGKSTLLRHLKPALAPHGRISGEVLFDGKPLAELSLRQQAQRIGFVQQNPDNQIVTDKVWHELAFGLESLGCDTPAIRRRVAEMASFFGMQTWFYKNITELSGGQKQLLNLAAVMVLRPDVLILDEPTAQLDPIAAETFLSTLGKINRELGTAVVLTEHRLEEALPLAQRAAVMDGGKILCSGAPAQVGAALKKIGHPMFSAMPAAMLVWSAVESGAPCPVTVSQGHHWLSAHAAEHALFPLPEGPVYPCSREIVLQAEQAWFKYEKNAPDVLKGLDLSLHRGEFLALLGGNGTGKTTSLQMLGGLLTPYRGTVRAAGRIALLPQNPQALFVKKTVEEDLYEVLRQRGLSKGEQKAQLNAMATLCRLTALLDRHPYDLSGGEQQRAALAKVLLLRPDILLLDEPTKGLDSDFKEVLAGILHQLTGRGTAVLMVSHDVEFCARHAHRCALFFDGAIVTEGTPRTFFSGNSFYTTAASRMARGIADDAVTTEDLIAMCGGALPSRPPVPENPPSPPPSPENASAPPTTETRKKLPLWRKLGALLSGGAALALFVRFVTTTDLTALVTADGITAAAQTQLRQYALFLLGLFILSACVIRRASRTNAALQTPRTQRKLTRRTLLASGILLLAVPLTLFVGVFYLGGTKYYFISLLIVLETMLPFFLVFEGRKPRPRELVVLATLCAIAVAGRAFFFMLPQCKPVMALTILSGVAFGGEAGFLVGAMSMLVSNILFGQGPLTPWQMFAMGLSGFFAGVLFRKGWLQRSRGALCVFGALAALVIYGGIMNPASAITANRTLSEGMLLSYYVTGMPFDCIHAAATWLFLWFGAEPMLEKLDRIKTKYGLIE